MPDSSNCAAPAGAQQIGHRPPPFWLKVGLGILGVQALAGIATTLSSQIGLARTHPIAWAVSLVANAAAVTCVEGAWRLRRWGVLGLAGLVLITLSATVAQIGLPVRAVTLVLLVALRIVPLLLVLLYTPRTT